MIRNCKCTFNPFQARKPVFPAALQVRKTSLHPNSYEASFSALFYDPFHTPISIHFEQCLSVSIRRSWCHRRHAGPHMLRTIDRIFSILTIKFYPSRIRRSWFAKIWNCKYRPGNILLRFFLSLKRVQLYSPNLFYIRIIVFICLQLLSIPSLCYNHFTDRLYNSPFAHYKNTLAIGYEYTICSSPLSAVCCIHNL